MATTSPSKNPASRTRAIHFILLFGLVSALGDITYETGRGVSGAFLAFLGASATSIGLVSGLGEFLGYGLRLVSGYLASRTRAYWVATFLGYGLLISIPLLAYTNRWEIAAIFLILERIGKAVRSPAKDTMLSHASYQVGRGWGFGIHEALDQVGAFLGPLIFAAVFAQRQSYRDGFTILWIPALLTLFALLLARLRVPNPEELENTPTTEVEVNSQKNSALPRVFLFYSAFTFFSVAGFANFQIISYHWVTRSIVPAAQIAIFYAVAMGVDAIAALIIGKTYDKFGLSSLMVVPLISLPLPFLAFSSRYPLAILAAVVWGIIMAVHETIMRAAIADIVPGEKRAFAYGIFNTLYGAAWFVSGALLGILYDQSRIGLFVAIVSLEILALLTFPFIVKSRSRQPESR
ncbi:permease of the major facilitator superfamily [Bellilinea caldifistulae]|uniref:MFS transporter n=1 Tax=Bellilinea caldifistulae TaxID=360411 RepID=A0A0P6WWZ4_9CHLR|nr:MFS transporter [Bellilinea caldifistulae]KPL70833.1 MFS transporter [Bellilinea caldifistulae]GAP10928.1 permease of the major facilitator superfamily [Bellilinea caldifistulae]